MIADKQRRNLPVRGVVAISAAIGLAAVTLLIGLAPEWTALRHRPHDSPLPSRALADALDYPPNQPHQPAGRTLDDVLLAPAGSCGALRLAYGTPVPAPSRECLAQALDEQRSKQLSIVRGHGQRTRITYLRSYAGSTGLSIWTARSGPGERTAWTLRRCPVASGLGRLGRCDRVLSPSPG